MPAAWLLKEMAIADLVATIMRVLAARAMVRLFLRHDFKFCDREDRPLLLSGDRSHHLCVTRRANIGSNSGNGDGVSSESHATPLDVSLVRFVEALAIADARRDHLALGVPPLDRETVDGSRTLQAGASNNDARRRLRKIFD